jgi:hypothetical protein
MSAAMEKQQMKHEPGPAIPADLPEDYVRFDLRLRENKLQGESDSLEGFVISMEIPIELARSSLDREALLDLSRSRPVSGELDYPDGRRTRIEYEVVNHRGIDEIYMKSTLGYFLWEYLAVQDDVVSFAFDWWYCPPATQTDLDILNMAQRFLSTPEHWHKEDDRKCQKGIDSGRWSLFCALKHASIESAGEYNHHNTAMQTVRFLIDEFKPDHGYDHTLMDYNNDAETSHGDILTLLEEAKRRIQAELSGRNS